ncbi:putative oxidoreductase SSP0419 isoform X3 [Dermacentor variabilis]|uniref:putative oxidoreductase SSP0419 isoform X3 n=1 Tax=Dermacentor variabilis TaxID=34621 RepID=UPI003F5B32F9
MPDLQGKVAVITGASSGIGAATAVRFASHGCWLALTGRNKKALESVAETCCTKGIPQDKVLVVPGDITIEEDIAAIVETTAKHFGKIDILVNSAGITMRKTLENSTVEDYNLVWQTNFRGPLWMIKYTVPYLRRTKGSIVNVSSIASTIAVNVATPYCVTKAALDHLSRCAALAQRSSRPPWENSLGPVWKTICGRWSSRVPHTPWAGQAPRTRLPAASHSWPRTTPPSSLELQCPSTVACSCSRPSTVVISEGRPKGQRDSKS